MQNRNFFAVGSIAAIIVLVLFIYPSVDNLINAGQSPYKPTLTNTYQISVTSNDVIAHYFEKDVADKVMKQPGCVGIRMYYGKKSNGKSGFMLVGVDKYGRDLNSSIFAGPGTLCPPHCE